MNPIIIDKDTSHELWRVTDCATYCGVTPATWRGYFRQGTNLTPPQPAAHLDGRTPLWDANEVTAWQANRPGSPVKNSPQPRT